jgi:hypothetical protein
MGRPKIVFAIHGSFPLPKFEVNYLEFQLANGELEPDGAIERAPKC